MLKLQDELAEAHYQTQTLEEELKAVHKDLKDAKEVNWAQQALLGKTHEVRKTAPISAKDVQRNLPVQPDLPIRPNPFDVNWTKPRLDRSASPQWSHPFPGAQPFQGPSDRDLDTIARNIPCFEPSPSGSHDTIAYMDDIDFYLHGFQNTTIDHKMCLIRVTSSCNISRFIDHQPDTVRTDYNPLCQALEKEFSDPLALTGLSTAMSINGQSRSHVSHPINWTVHHTQNLKPCSHLRN